MTQLVVKPVDRISGSAKLPGDKSISQRAALMAALARGVTRIEGYLQGEDALNTLHALELLGAEVKRSEDVVTVAGVGERGFHDPDSPLYLGNSGTGLRLLLGVLAGQPAFAVLTGDTSLSRRPMARVTRPLQQMGARIDGREGGNLLPLVVRGGQLQGIEYNSPVASAQVKSSILLAGLGAAGVTRVSEPAPSRDHTERMLPAFGATVRAKPGWAEVEGPCVLRSPGGVKVPADPSSAAFPVVAALIAGSGSVSCDGVSINPTRTGWIDVLRKMGADLTVEGSPDTDGEPIGSLRAREGGLNGVTISGAEIPRTIDEIPVLCVAAARAAGKTVVRDAEELRVKESDRIRAICREWAKIGLEVTERNDGLEIDGPQTITGGLCDSHGDHRIAMALAVAATVAEAPVVIDNAECIKTSFPTFVECMRSIGVDVCWRDEEGVQLGAAK